MSNLFRISILLAVSATLFTCGDNPTEGYRLIFEDFTEAGMFCVSTPGVYVFRDDDSWSAFGDEYWDDPWMRYTIPEVDFETEMVIGIFWGTRPHGCYFWVDCIEGIFIDHNVIEVHIAPLPELGECAMPVCPLQVVKLERYDLPLELHGHILGER
ncbi:MAG: hypothetical protein JSW64_00990 [Candidatus Zixiibacteriota bacterium]|nr:MAG: hypothetical protein JSW64_00990 [candidate division Zixibacteria bacterium]